MQSTLNTHQFVYGGIKKPKPKHNSDERGSNIVRVKNLDNSYQGNQKYQCQFNYAVKCFEDFEYKDLKILARGQAVPRGTRLVADVFDWLSTRGDQAGQACEMGFQDPFMPLSKNA